MKKIILGLWGNTAMHSQPILGKFRWEDLLLNEDILHAAQRELREETGLEAKRWDKILHLHTSNAVSDEEGYVYIARELTQHETAFDETEDLKIMRLPLEEALQMVFSVKLRMQLA